MARTPAASRRRPVRLAAVAAAAALTLAACGATTSENAGSAPAGTEQAAASPFTGEFETLSGDTIDLGSLEGQDVVLWFWAPW